MSGVAGIVLAGGAASRLGGQKALLPFRGDVLLDAVIGRAAPQVSILAINVAREEEPRYRERFADRSLIVDGLPKGTGPLAGVVSGLEWLQRQGGAQWLATFPCDTPFLPRDLVAQLMADVHDGPVFARDDARMHGVCAVWPVSCGARLREGVERGTLRSIHSAMEALGGETRLIRAEAHAFFNINTHEDLATAEQLAEQIA